MAEIVEQPIEEVILNAHIERKMIEAAIEDSNKADEELGAFLKENYGYDDPDKNEDSIDPFSDFLGELVRVCLDSDKKGKWNAVWMRINKSEGADIDIKDSGELLDLQEEIVNDTKGSEFDRLKKAYRLYKKASVLSAKKRLVFFGTK